MKSLTAAIAFSLAGLFAQISIPHVPSIPGIPTGIPIPPLAPSRGAAIVAQPSARLTQIDYLDGFSPARYASLADLASDGQGGFRIAPGAYELVDQSFCLNAGAHGPGSTDAYAIGSLGGTRAGYVRDVMLHWQSHPEIDQSSVQTLIWAITSGGKISDESSGVRSTARALLSAGQIDQINGGALGLITDALGRAGVALPAAAQQLLDAQSRLRSLLANGNASYQQLEAIAVLPPVATGESGRDRWSYDPQGYFIRYLPERYSETTVQIVRPRPYAFARDANGRIVSMSDTQGTTLSIRYGGTAGMTLRIAPPGIDTGNYTQVVPLGSSKIAARRLSGSVPASIRSEAESIDAIARSAEARVDASRARFDKGAARNFLRSALPSLACASLGGCNGAQVASAFLVALGPSDPSYSPTADMGAPANGSKQPLGQSGKPSKTDKNKDCDRVKSQLAFAEGYKKRYEDPTLVDAAKKSGWTGQEFEDAVNQKNWADMVRSGKSTGSAGRVGGYTDFTDCTAHTPTEQEVIDDGLPPIMYQVIRNHEGQHVADCLANHAKGGQDTWQWRQKTEEDAYDQSIKTMKDWMAQNC